jgi:hypothetical protein
LVYYHPDELPPSYDVGSFDPAEHGFGPVTHTVPALTEALAAIIDRKGTKDTPGPPPLDPQWEQRVQSFFAFHDRRNCERIYAELRDCF